VSSGRTYLDWNATAPMRPEAREAMLAALELSGNASSVHAEGRAARGAVEDAREKVAALVGARATEVVFVSGATEANAMVLRGRKWGSVVSSGMEHPSVSEPVGNSASLRISAGPDGTAAIDHRLGLLLDSLRHEDGSEGGLPEPLLVSHHFANGETGVVHDIAALVGICRAVRPDAVIHTDAVQAAGRVPFNFASLGVDAMTLSAHKLGGPKGVGALILRDGLDLEPLMRGGGQERRLRSGTENVPAIAGFGAAADAARRNLAAEALHMRRLRERLEMGIRDVTPDVIVIGGEASRLPNTSCIALPGRSSELLVIALDLMGIAVSAGSACSSGKVAASPTLRAMGLADEIQRSAIRVSLGWATTDSDVAAFIAAWTTIAATRRAAA
jgi:cysteine desulfurase